MVRGLFNRLGSPPKQGVESHGPVTLPPDPDYIEMCKDQAKVHEAMKRIIDNVRTAKVRGEFMQWTVVRGHQGTHFVLEYPISHHMDGDVHLVVSLPYWGVETT